jgi:hypothetical protein
VAVLLVVVFAAEPKLSIGAELAPMPALAARWVSTTPKRTEPHIAFDASAADPLAGTGLILHA